MARGGGGVLAMEEVGADDLPHFQTGQRVRGTTETGVSE